MILLLNRSNDNLMLTSSEEQIVKEELTKVKHCGGYYIKTYIPESFNKGYVEILNYNKQVVGYIAGQTATIISYMANNIYKNENGSITIPINSVLFGSGR